MNIVIRIGGSVIASPTNPALINRFAAVIEKLRKGGHDMIVVVGGGALAREFIRIGDQLGLNEAAQDNLAIQISRLYAWLFTLRLQKDETGNIPSSMEKAIEIFKRKKMVVVGGMMPGMTTDAVAAYAAKEIEAKLLIKATDQDGIYNKDPRKFKDAEKIEEISYNELKGLLAKNTHKAGIHQILDPVALEILQKTNIKTIIVNGYNPQNVQDAVEGKKIGTVITEQRINTASKQR